MVCRKAGSRSHVEQKCSAAGLMVDRKHLHADSLHSMRLPVVVAGQPQRESMGDFRLRQPRHQACFQVVKKTVGHGGGASRQRQHGQVVEQCVVAVLYHESECPDSNEWRSSCIPVRTCVLMISTGRPRRQASSACVKPRKKASSMSSRCREGRAASAFRAAWPRLISPARSSTACRWGARPSTAPDSGYQSAPCRIAADSAPECGRFGPTTRPADLTRRRRHRGAPTDRRRLAPGLPRQGPGLPGRAAPSHRGQQRAVPVWDNSPAAFLSPAPSRSSSFTSMSA